MKLKINEFSQLKQERRISEEEIEKRFANLKEQFDNILGMLKNRIEDDRVVEASLDENVTSTLSQAQALSGEVGQFYKQEGVLSILRDFTNVNYNVDLTSTQINYTQCRQVIKFILAIIIGEDNQSRITEQSIEEALELIDDIYHLMPSQLSFALAKTLNNFVNFAQKVSTANKQLYLVDARSRWEAGIWVKTKMAFGEIPCKFLRERTIEGGRTIVNINISFSMFFKDYMLVVSMSEDNQVTNLKLRVA